VKTIEKWGIVIDDAEKTFKQIDKDGAGMILFEEFCYFAAS
jgi:Ca2+-binding EF-hand superfamily protein